MKIASTVVAIITTISLAGSQYSAHAATPTDDQRGYYSGNVTTTLTYFDSSKPVKVKSRGIVEIGPSSIYLSAAGPNGIYFSGQGSGNYGPYHGVYVGPNGLNGRLSFKGTGDKVTLTLKGTYTSVNVATPYTAEISGKLKKHPE